MGQNIHFAFLGKSLTIFEPVMKATRFFIALCLLLLGGKALDAGAVSYASHISSVTTGFQQGKPNGQFALFENAGETNKKSFLLCDEVDDEDERNSLAKKYKELSKYAAVSSWVQLFNHYKALKVVIVPFCQAGNSPRYILLRTLRI